MKCPKCNCEGAITKTSNIFNQSEGKLYREVRISCRNRKCPSYKKIFKINRSEIKVVLEGNIPEVIEEASDE